jgi:PAS domain S-box-containing protein
MLAPLGMIFAWLYSQQGILPIIFLAGPFLYTRHAIEQAHQALKEQKQIQDKLRFSEEKFSRAFHASPMAIVIQRASDRRYFDINEGFTRITGYRREEALEHTISELNLYPDKEISARLGEQLRRDGFVRDFEIPFRRKNGEIGYGLTWGEPIEINGEMMYIAGTIDITERKKLETLQSEQAQEIKTLYDALSEITAIHGDIKFLSQKITDIIVGKFHAYKCALWLLSEDHASLTRLASSGQDVIEKVNDIPVNSVGLIPFALKNGETIYAPDVQADPRYLSIDETTHSEYVVPLQAYGETIGVLNMESPRLDDFNERTRRLVAAFAQNATLAIQNARLLDSLETNLTSIREYQARINFFLEHTAEGVYRIDYDPPIPIHLPIEEQFKLSVEHGKIAECNDAFARMYGASSREELLGKPYIEFYGEEGYEANMEGNLTFYRQGYKIDDLETEEFNLKGEKVYFTNNVVGIIRDGLFVSTWGTQRDITPLKNALAELGKLNQELHRNLTELKESQARFNYFIEHTTEGVYRVDYDPPIPIDLPFEEQYRLSRERGKFGEANLAIAKMYGYSTREEMLAAPYHGNNEGNEASLKANVEFYRNGYKADDTETEEYTPSGEKAHFVNNAIGIVRDGYFMGIWGTQRDITPLKNALAELGKLNQELHRNLTELKESQARINFFLEHTAEGIYRIDFDPPIPITLPFEEQFRLSVQRGTIAECNEAIARMYGFSSREEMLGKPYADFYGEEGLDANLEANLDFYHQGYKIDDIETEEFNSEGEKVYFTNNVIGIIRDGYFVSTWGAQRDITPLKKVLAELEKRNAELERFNYTLSHELKTPIVTIRGFLGFLETDIKTGNVERAKADLARIGHAADKMYKMISELLELSRIGRIINPPEDVPFEEVVQAGLNNAEASIKEHNIQVQVQPNLPIVHVDLTRLIEVIQNLVENAIKYMGGQSAPQITIGVRSEGNEQIFFVSDNGMGIDPEYHERVFNIFEKLNPQSEGTGIGLAIVKRIIEMHGGRIWVESEGLGKGTTFCFTLPTTKL